MVATGYEYGNDANELRHDPGFKLLLECAPETGAARCPQPAISRVKNLPDTRTLIRMGHELVQVCCNSFKYTPGQIVRDIDNTFDAVHGEQLLRLFNTYYH